MLGEAVARKIYLIVGLFVAIAICILALDRFQSYMLNSVRAYVAGNGHWSKAQEGASYHLLHYATRGNEAEYHLFEKALMVFQGDRQARKALQRAAPDKALAKTGFLEGGNDPEDVPALISFFLHFSHIGPMRHAIAIWTAADDQMDELSRLGAQIHRIMASGQARPEQIRRILSQVDATNTAVTRLESQFSTTIEQAARNIHRLTDTAIIAFSLLLLALGIMLARQIIAGIRRAQNTLHDSEVRLRAVIDNAIIGIAFWDNDGYIVDANDTYLTMLGYTRTDLTEQRINWQRMSPDAYREQDQEAARLIREQGFCPPYEKEYIRRDGHHVPVFMGTARLNAAGGVAFVLNISLRKQLENRLQQMQKMESIATLVGGIAHDFNNTLAATQGNLYLAKQEAKDQPRIAERLDTIERLGTHSAEIVQQLLTFASKGIVHMQPMSMNELCTRIAHLVAPRLTEGLEFTMDLGDETLMVKGDAAQLEQVMMHLLTNARDALADTPAPAIHCRLARFEPDGAFRQKHRRLGPGPAAHLQVRDNGCGMSESQLEHVFEPFFTTKKVGKGTGLGMAMVYGSMRTHRGAVTVDSAEGLGTTVDLYLPLLDTDA